MKLNALFLSQHFHPMKSFATALFILVNSLAFAQFNRLDPTSKSAIENMITDQKTDQKMVGLSVGIIRDGEISYLKGFGFQDSANQIAATEHTLYRLASVSKSITGLMAMRLIEKDLLDLDKDIRDYVPEYPVKPEGTITSEHLLSNESGIIHYSGSGSMCNQAYNITALNSYVESHQSTYDPIKALDIFKDQKICFKPGDHYQYTTWGFCLMGAVIQRAAKSSFENVLYDEIICPLKLPTLQIEYPLFRPYVNEAVGYEKSNGSVQGVDTNTIDYRNISYKVPGGGLISSVIDLTLLMKGVVNRELISDEMLKLFGTRHIPEDGEPSYYGYGTSSNFRNGDTLFWHSGSQNGTATLIYYSPENKNGVALMCNTQNVSLFPLARLIYDYLPNSNLQGEGYLNNTAQARCNTGNSITHLTNYFSLFPNPSNGAISVQMTEDIGSVKMTLIDLQGKTVLYKYLSFAPSQEVELNLNPGTYQVLFQLDATVIHQQHIILPLK